MLQLHEHSRAIDSLAEFTSRLPNHSLLQIHPIGNKPNNTKGQKLIAPIFSSFKFTTKQPSDEENEKFLIKSFKLMKVPKKNRNNDQLHSSLNDNFDSKQNLIMKLKSSDNKQQNNNNKSTKLHRTIVNNTVRKTKINNDLQFRNIRKKPKRKKIITDSSYHHLQKPEINDKFVNTLTVEMQQHQIRPNIIINTLDKLEKPANHPTQQILIREIPIITDNDNASIKQQILIEKIHTKRPIRTRKAKIFGI